MPSALVHIGTHKTGTTAFQQWCYRHRDELLARRGVGLYEGRYGLSHYEIALLCQRPNRTMGKKRATVEWCLDEWRVDMKAHVAEQVARPTDGLLISAEALSLLRYEDEVEALAEVLAPRQLRVAVCLRDPHAFLDSYRRELLDSGRTPSPYRSSHEYVEPDTWLIRWDDMLVTWRAVLGDENVVSFDYDEAMAAEGSTIPGVLESLDIDRTDLPKWDGVQANVTLARSGDAGAAGGLRSTLGRLKRSVLPPGTPPSA